VMYAKAIEGGQRPDGQGAIRRLVGILEVGIRDLSDAVTKIGRRLNGALGAASLVEWILAGIVIWAGVQNRHPPQLRGGRWGVWILGL